MANNRFNKQVTPKGYKMGGRVSKMGGGMMKRPMYKDGSKTQDALRAAARDMNKTGQGKKFREATFVDSKTNRIVPDTERNRKRYGKDRVKATTAKGRVKRAMGGSLKPVDKEKNPGLSKLPTKVRNKMGFMKKGGMVPNKKYIKKIAKELRKK